MGGRSMVIDEDCPICKMMATSRRQGEKSVLNYGRKQLDESFAFSSFKTNSGVGTEQLELER